MLHMRHATFSWHQQQQHKLKQTATGQTREALAFNRCNRKGKFQKWDHCDSSKRNLLQFLVLIRLENYTKFKQLTTGGVAVGLLEVKNQLESFWRWIHFIVYSVFVFFFWHWSISVSTVTLSVPIVLSVPFRAFPYRRQKQVHSSIWYTEMRNAAINWATEQKNARHFQN